MRHVFIINPHAGKYKPAVKLVPEIEEYFSKNGGTYSIRYTEYHQHAVEIAREEAEKGDPVRLYVCGGDGSLFEVLNGMFGFDHCQIAMFPCGSGNDYIRTYGEKEAFLDIASQVEGKPVLVDVIKAGDCYALNICSMGLDAKVGDKVIRFKKLPLISGSMAYNLSVLNVFLGRIGETFTITIDDQEKLEGDFLFALAASGRYYGGGFMGAPGACPTDGLLDFVIVRPVSRLKVPFIVQKYKNGEHEEIAQWLTHAHGKKMTVSSKKISPVNTDGEIIQINEITFEIIPKSVQFIIPKHVCPDWIINPQHGGIQHKELVNKL